MSRMLWCKIQSASSSNRTKRKYRPKLSLRVSLSVCIVIISEDCDGFGLNVGECEVSRASSVCREKFHEGDGRSPRGPRPIVPTAGPLASSRGLHWSPSRFFLSQIRARPVADASHGAIKSPRNEITQGAPGISVRYLMFCLTTDFCRLDNGRTSEYCHADICTIARLSETSGTSTVFRPSGLQCRVCNRDREVVCFAYGGWRRRV